MRRHENPPFSPDILYDHLNQLLYLNPICPPISNDQLRLFDIVIIRPDGPQYEMIEPTTINLSDLISEDEKNDLYQRVQRHDDTDEKRLSSMDSWSQKGRGYLRQQSLFSKSEFDVYSSRIVDLTLRDGSKVQVRYGICRLVEKYIYKYFAKLITNPSFHRHIHERFLIGVTAGVTTGKLYSTMKERNHVYVSHADGPNDENLTNRSGQGRTSQESELVGDGVIGVNMVCFLVRCDSEKKEYNLSRGIHVNCGNENQFLKSREYVQHGRRNRNLFLRWRQNSENLFAAGHFISADDPQLDEDSRNEFIRVTEAVGDNS